MPPSTLITWPVIKVERSDDKNKQRFATSCGVPPLFNGIPLIHWSTTSWFNLSVISVRINPGATTFDLIFLEPSSRAIDFENPIIPAFDAA